MSNLDDIERIRAKAIEIGLSKLAIDGFAQMDRDTLILQAALWHQVAIAHQNQRLEIEMKSGQVIVDLFDLCRERGIDVPEAIYEAVNAINEPSAAPKI